MCGSSGEASGLSGACTGRLMDESDKGRSFYKILRSSSAGVDLIFLGMATPSESVDFASYYEQLRARTDGMPTTVFVLAARDIGFEEVLA